MDDLGKLVSFERAKHRRGLNRIKIDGAPFTSYHAVSAAASHVCEVASGCHMSFARRPVLVCGWVLTALSVAFLPHTASAVLKTWQEGSGNWADDNQWEPFGQPQNGDDVILSDSGNGDDTVDFDSAVTLNLNSLSLRPIRATITLYHTNGTLGAANFSMTSPGASVYRCTTGRTTLAVTGTLSIGNDNVPGVSALLDHKSGIISANTIDLANGGTFNVSSAGRIDFTTFNQTGGTANLPDFYSPSFTIYSGRTYNLAGGSSLGRKNVYGGTFNQTGGLSQGRIDLYYGAYNLSAGTLASVGFSMGPPPGNTSLFTQTGGVHNASFLSVADAGTGTYELKGGILDAQSLVLGNGQTSVATFKQSGGTNTVANALTLALNPGSSGTYQLQNGALNAGSIQLNAGGTFNQTGGTLNATTFNHSGGTVTGVLQNQGTFNYSGGDFQGRLLNQGTVNIVPPALVLGDGLDNRANFAIALQRTLTLNGAPSSNSGSISLDNAVLAGIKLVNQSTGTLSGNGRIELDLTNLGTISSFGVNLTIAGPLDNQGTIGNGVGSNLFVQSPTFANAGNVVARSGGSVIFNVPLTNPGGKSITLAGGGLAAPSIVNAAGAIIVGAGDINGDLSNSGSVSFSGQARVFGAFLNNPGGTLTVLNDQTSVTGPATNQGAVTADHATIIFDAGLTSPAPQPAAGAVTVGPGARLVSAYIRQAELHLDGAPGALALALLRRGGPTSVLRQLEIPNSPSGFLGQLDLADAALVIDYTGPSPLASVRSYIVGGYGTGAAHWAGTGLVSSSAAADPSKALGYAEAADVLSVAGGTFRGQQVDSTSVLVRYTFTGDATLDGAVNFQDLVRLAQHYDQTVSATTDGWWSRGDFTYDGKVGFDDLVKLAQNYNSVLPADPVPGAAAGFEADLLRAFDSVPEPSFTAFAVIAICACIRRRRPAGPTSPAAPAPQTPYPPPRSRNAGRP
jgi:hypothetical protein